MQERGNDNNLPRIALKSELCVDGRDRVARRGPERRGRPVEA